MTKTRQTSGSPAVLALHGNRLGKSLLRERVSLCRAILTAFDEGRTPEMQDGKRYWSDMALADGTSVQLGTQIALTVHARTPKGDVWSIDVECPPGLLESMHPTNVVDIAVCLNIAVTALEAALKGNSAKAIKGHLRDLTLAASREALGDGMIADRVGIVLPSAFGKARITLHSNYTAGIDRMKRTTALADRLPHVVQVCQDHIGGVTVERHPYQMAKRRWTAASREGPLARAA